MVELHATVPLVLWILVYYDLSYFCVLGKNAPRERIVFILLPFDFRNAKDHLHGPGHTHKWQDLDQCLTDTTNELLAGFWGRIFGLREEIGVELDGDFWQS